MPGTPAPVGIGALGALPEIPLKHGLHLAREHGVVHFLVGLEIPAQVPAVEIARTDRNPVVAQYRLGVQEPRLVFVDTHPGPQQAAVETPAGVADRATFLGLVAGAQKQALLREGTLFLLPSEDENFGVSVIEAMAAGIPVVGTPVGGISDFLANRETGLFCGQDAEDIADKIKIIFDDKDLRNKLIKNARALVEEKYDWNKIVGKYRRLYETI